MQVGEADIDASAEVERLRLENAVLRKLASERLDGLPDAAKQAFLQASMHRTKFDILSVMMV